MENEKSNAELLEALNEVLSVLEDRSDGMANSVRLVVQAAFEVAEQLM